MRECPQTMRTSRQFPEQVRVFTYAGLFRDMYIVGVFSIAVLANQHTVFHVFSHLDSPPRYNEPIRVQLDTHVLLFDVRHIKRRKELDRMSSRLPQFDLQEMTSLTNRPSTDEWKVALDFRVK